MAPGRLSLYHPWCEAFRTQGYTVQVFCGSRQFAYLMIQKQDPTTDDSSTKSDVLHMKGFEKLTIILRKLSEHDESEEFLGKVEFWFAHFGQEIAINPIQFKDNHGNVVLSLNWELKFIAGDCNMFRGIECLHAHKVCPRGK